MSFVFVCCYLRSVGVTLFVFVVVVIVVVVCFVRARRARGVINARGGFVFARGCQPPYPSCCWCCWLGCWQRLGESPGRGLGWGHGGVVRPAGLGWAGLGLAGPGRAPLMARFGVGWWGWFGHEWTQRAIGEARPGCARPGRGHAVLSLDLRCSNCLVVAPDYLVFGLRSTFIPLDFRLSHCFRAAVCLCCSVFVYLCCIPTKLVRRFAIGPFLSVPSRPAVSLAGAPSSCARSASSPQPQQ